MTKAIKKKIKKDKDPFQNHKRTKESNLPFVKASRVLVTDPTLKAIFNLKEYNGDNELGGFTEDRNSGEIDIQESVKSLVVEIARLKSMLSKTKVEDSE